MLTSEVIAKQFKLKKFLMAMYKDAGIDFTKEKIRVFESNGEYNKVTFFNDIDDLVSFSTKKQRIYKNTYFTLSSVDTNAENGQAESLVYRYCLGFDFDKKDFGEGFNYQSILDKLNNLGLWGHCAIDSGNGYHVYMFIERTNDLKKVEDVQIVLAKLLGADLNATKTTQILRLPYTWNVKDKRKEVKIIHMFERNTIKRYNIDKLYNRFCSSFREDSNNKILVNGNFPPCVEKALNNGSKVGQRNKDLFNIVIALKQRGRSVSRINSIVARWNSLNEEALQLEQLYKDVERIYNNYNGYICNACNEENKNDCRSYVVSDFDLEQYEQPIITIQKKVGREARDSKRKGVRTMNGNELFIYNVLVNNAGFEVLNIDLIMERITDRKTKKCALSKKTILNTLKSLEEKGYITINKGNTRQGIRDTYVLNKAKLNADNSFKITYFINILVIKGEISTTELKVYTRMRYLHNEEVKAGRAKGNIFTITLDDLAKSLEDDKANVSRYVTKLYESMVLDRRAIQCQDNPGQFYYEYKLNM
ncbi:MAG: hypothetical protein E7K67_01410 [Peptostreptococcaceae bacterium]|nr:hypothetical protein [Peptostreptococcaceae bacterium]